MANTIVCPHCGKSISFVGYYNARNKAQHTYYHKHKKEILEKAKQRRIADPEYRKKLNQYQLDRYYKQKEARDAENNSVQNNA